MLPDRAAMDGRLRHGSLPFDDAPAFGGEAQAAEFQVLLHQALVEELLRQLAPFLHRVFRPDAVGADTVVAAGQTSPSGPG